MSELTGVELTAKFFEACGREVRLKESVGYWQWCSGGEKYNVWSPVPDFTQPGHLEEVIGMVRERWPEGATMVSVYHEEGNAMVSLLGLTDGSGGALESAESPTVALMLAAIRAAGMET